MPSFEMNVLGAVSEVQPPQDQDDEDQDDKEDDEDPDDKEIIAGNGPLLHGSLSYFGTYSLCNSGSKRAVGVQAVGGSYVSKELVRFPKRI